MNDGLCVGLGVAEWVAERIGAPCPHDSVGIGWARGGQIVMGAMFNGYNGASIQMHLAVLPGHGMARQWVWAMMDYAFCQAKVRRITGLIAEKNERSKRFAEHLGARCEGILKDALPDGNLMVYGLLKNDAKKWLTAGFQRILR